MKDFSTTLYKIDTKGKVREWTIEVSGGAYRTIYGEKDGQLITSEWTECKSKNIGRSNETSASEQAIFEATAIIKKQREKGYGDTPVKKTGDVMLAKNYDDYADKIKFPVYSQPKLDGIRCYVTKHGMFTRNHKPIVSCPHIFNSLFFVFKTDESIRIDGELYNHSLREDFNKICSLVKKIKPTQEDLQESAKIIEYWVYDIGDITKKFSERLSLRDIYLDKKQHIRLLRTDIVNNQKELDVLYEDYLIEGNEGQIIRLDAHYEEKRSKNLLKRKEFQTDEFEILEVIEGDGNKSSMAGAMRVKNKQNQEFRSNIKGNREWLRELLQKKDKLVGKMATIQYFNLTPDGICRFPYVLSIRDYE